MGYYRRKTERIEARQVTAGELDRIADWCGGEVLYNGQGAIVGMLVGERPHTRLCVAGDWVMCDHHGNFDVLGHREMQAYYELDPATADRTVVV
jgi:hypothetical protein